MEKEMATHSSILAWKIPWTEEPGGLQSMESQRVRQDLATEHTYTGALLLTWILEIGFLLVCFLIFYLTASGVNCGMWDLVP